MRLSTAHERCSRKRESSRLLVPENNYPAPEAKCASIRSSARLAGRMLRQSPVSRRMG